MKDTILKKIPQPRGSFTIEAAVIVPLTLFIICSAILISLDLHDSAILKSEAISKIFESLDGTEENEAALLSVETTLSERLITNDTVSVSLNETDNNVTLTCNAASDGETVTVNISNLDARAVLLKYKALNDGVENITGRADG